MSAGDNWVAFRRPTAAVERHVAEVIALVPVDASPSIYLADAMPAIEAELLDQLRDLGFSPDGAPDIHTVPVYPAGRAWLVRWTGTREAS